jgi:hypothetical protein
MTTRMQQRRGTSTQWTNADPVLAAGEIGVETDTNQFKLGDGVSVWSDLSYFQNLGDLGSSLDDYILLSTKGVANGVATLDGSGQIPSSQLANIINGAPAALDTLNEIASVLGNSSNITGNIISNLAQIDTTLNSLGGTVTTLTTNYGTLSTTVSGHTTSLATQGASISDGVTNLNTHKTTTTNVHGIADTATLATKAYADGAVSTHEADTTNVHGITDTAALATKSYADAQATNAQTAAQSAASTALTAHNTATTSVHGISNTANLVYTSDSRLSDTRTPTDSSVTAAKIASDAVTTAKILDGNVTTSKHADASITTAKIADSAITSAKIADATIVDGDISSSAAIATSKISGLDTALSAKAPLASPALTGTPTAPTASAGTATTQIATTAFVGTAVSNLVASAPAALDTLNELATALGNDASFSTTVTNALAAKAPLASPTFTGTVTLPATGIVFSDGTQSKEGVPSRTPIVSKTASYTLSALTERDSVIEVNSASAVTITVPTNSTIAYPIGTSIDILQTGAGQITVAGASGVTVNATPGLKLRTQWSGATLFKRATDTWVLYGDLSA